MIRKEEINMKCKKTIAILMAAAMSLAAAYPAAAVTTAADSAPAAAAETAEAAGRIASVRFQDNYAILSLTASKDGKAVVEICEDSEAGTVLFSSAETVKAGDIKAEIKLENELPESFMLRAKLTSEDGKTVYSTYTNPLFTKEVQDMLKTEPVAEKTREQWLAECEECFDYVIETKMTGDNDLKAVALHLASQEKAKALKHLVVPETHSPSYSDDTTPLPVIGIMSGTLKDCSELETAELPEGLLYLDGTFFDKDKLKQLIFPTTLTYIGEDTVRGCSSISSLVIPSKVNYISRNAFMNMDGLETIIFLPSEAENVTVEINTCKLNPKLKTAKIYAAWDSVPVSTFNNDTALETVILPDTVKKIGSIAFGGCKSLAKLDLPDGLQEIEDSAFSGCVSLKSIDLPASVTTLGKEVFGRYGDDMIGITDVTIRNPQLSTESLENAFSAYLGNQAGKYTKPVLHGYSGSTTAQFAADKGFEFIPLDSAEPLTTTAPAPATTAPAQTTAANPAVTTASVLTTTAAPETTPAPETTGKDTTDKPADVKYGDADCSGNVDVSDAVLICRFATEDAGVTITDQGKKNADVTGDGHVKADDSIKILRFIAKLIKDTELAP